jgi:hypothetical protein
LPNKTILTVGSADGRQVFQMRFISRAEVHVWANKEDSLSVSHWENKALLHSRTAHFKECETLALDAFTNEVYTTPPALGTGPAVPPSK